jgi:nucleoside-diphosphate-sugar epimerase
MTAIVHAAGLAHVFGPESRNPAFFNAVNEEGTRCLVEAGLACGVPHVVLVSSVSVYGEYLGAICDETVPCHPQGPYAISKWRGELRAIGTMAKGPGSLTILRFATIYGEGDRGNVAELIGALDRRRFIWPGSGQNQKSLIYKEDAVRACLCALERPVSGIEVFNVSARPATMREVVSAICQALGRPIPRLRIPSAFLRAAWAMSRSMGDPGQLGQRLEKFIHDDVYDGSKFETTFDFCPAISLSEGMRREVDFLRGRITR